MVASDGRRPARVAERVRDVLAEVLGRVVNDTARNVVDALLVRSGRAASGAILTHCACHLVTYVRRRRAQVLTQRPVSTIFRQCFVKVLAIWHRAPSKRTTV